MNGFAYEASGRVQTLSRKTTSDEVEGRESCQIQGRGGGLGKVAWFCIADKQVEPEEGYRVLSCTLYSEPLTEHLLTPFTYNDLLKASN